MKSAGCPIKLHKIAPYTVTLSYLYYNVFERGCEAISGKKCKITRSCLTSTLKNIVTQLKNGNCKKGNWLGKVSLSVASNRQFQWILLTVLKLVQAFLFPFKCGSDTL